MPCEPLARTGIKTAVGKEVRARGSVFGWSDVLRAMPRENVRQRVLERYRAQGFTPDDFGRRATARAALADALTRAEDWDDLQAVYMNTAAVDVREIAMQIQAAGGNALESVRTNAAAVSLFNASNMLHSALALHLHPVRWNDRAACALLRVAFECAGRAALIANGTSDEVHRWETGEEFKASDCVAALDAVMKKAKPGCPDAKRVYGWLCNFSHMNYHGALHFYLAQEGGNEDAFTALAVVSWAVAEVTTIVIGTDLGATYPAKLPTKLPWD